MIFVKNVQTLDIEFFYWFDLFVCLLQVFVVELIKTKVNWT